MPPADGGSEPSTIPGALARAARENTPGLTFHLEEGVVRLPAAELYRSALHGASVLASLGVRPGDAVGILGPNLPQWARWAFAVWQMGGVVTPISFPVRVRDRRSLAEHVDGLIAAAGCRVLLADPSLLDVVPAHLAVPWDEPQGNPEAESETGFQPLPDDIAVLQFTSGSTAGPKRVPLSHAAILSAYRSMAKATGVRPGRDQFLSWMPFFHVAGLFGCVVRPVVVGIGAHVLPTRRFVRDPLLWFHLVAQTGATLTNAPSSAWAAAVRAAERDRPSLDLSSLRRATFAAEITDPAVVDRLVEMGQRYGLSPGAVACGYGMSESLAVTATAPGCGIRIDSVGIRELALGRAEAAPGSPQKRVASCGLPNPGIEVRIGSPSDPLGDRRVGEILVRSPSTMRGYVGSSEPDPLVGGWYRTGDLGYLADGELFVTGRSKEIIIALGQNHAPHDIEWAAARVPGVRPDRCVAFGRPDGHEGEVVVVVEATPGTEIEAIPSLVRSAVADAVGLTPREVLVVPIDTVPITTSGKLQRSALRAAYAEGSLRESALTRIP